MGNPESVKNIIPVEKFDSEKLMNGVNPEIKNEIPEIFENTKKSKEMQNALTENIMENISSIDFLKHPQNQRLVAITNPKFKSSELVKNLEEGRQQDIEFKFSFNGKLNNELYMNITAGEVLPEEVRKIKDEKGEVFIRKGTTGEFFNFKNERLIIHDKTRITVLNEKYNKESEAKKTEKQIKKIEEKNPEAKKNPELVRKAVEKGIEPNFILLVFGKLINSFFGPTKDKGSLIESLVTDVSREAGRNRISQDVGANGNLATSLALLIMNKYSGNKQEFQKNAKDYGIKENEVKNFNLKESYETKSDFYKLVISKAKEVQKIYGVPWQVTVGQAILESGHGQSKLAKKYNNFFGHIARPGQKSVEMLDNGHLRKFAVYDSVSEGLMAHGKFLSSDRYKRAFYFKNNPKKFIKEVQKAGYAEDPNYVANVLATIRARGINI